MHLSCCIPSPSLSIAYIQSSHPYIDSIMIHTHEQCVRPPIVLQYSRRKKKDSARIIKDEGTHYICVSGSEDNTSEDHSSVGDHS